MVLLNACTWVAVLGLDGEHKRENVGVPRLEASPAFGPPSEDAILVGDLSFSDCIAIPVVITTTLTDVLALTSSSIRSPNASPIATCSRLTRHPAKVNDGVNPSGPDSSHHSAPLPLETNISPCQDSEFPTNGLQDHDSGTGGPAATKSIPDGAPTPLRTHPPSPGPTSALPAWEPVRSIHHIFGDKDKSSQDELPFSTSGNESVRDVP
ncbi:unnamed protein product [Rhizoctonia solani]|uniref:Uncharacterized protein n=1 Tax=Rhizoctonia solani TaxID=456999 RepID=A0A8H2XE03_9AGAM|nr:unnamed protein product [Rhizoctonia solani]